MIRLATSLALLLALAASAGAQTATMEEGTPSATVAAEDHYRRVVARAVDDYIIPAYSRLQGATGELGPALSDLCLFDGDHERFSVAHAFSSTIEAWAGVDFLRFGPMAQEGRYERFAFFPDVHGTGARQLRRFLATEDEALLKPGALR